MSKDEIQKHFEYLNNQFKVVNEIIDDKLSNISCINNNELLKIEKFYLII